MFFDYEGWGWMGFCFVSVHEVGVGGLQTYSQSHKVELTKVT